MWWRGLLKALLVFVLISGAVIVMWFGVVQTLFGRPWMRLVGLLMLAGGFRAIILGFDLMWGRPPSFSKRPWERPWEKEPRRPPGY